MALTQEQTAGLQTVYKELQTRQAESILANQTRASYEASQNATTGNTTVQTSWTLSGWSMDANGNWITQPSLTIDGQTYIYDNPTDYISKLQQLKNQGVSGNIDQMISEFNNAVPSYTKKTSSTSTTTTTPIDTSIPQELKDDENYKSLDDATKTLVDTFYASVAAQGTYSTDTLSKALDLAIEQADPYWKEKINIVKDTLKSTIATKEADLVSDEKTLSDRISQINEDLIYNKENLTIDQQAELEAEADTLQANLDTTRELMATRGLTSSTISTQAKEKLSSSYSDVVESVNRKYERENRTEETTAARNIALYQQQIADAQRTAQEAKTTAAKTAEQYLGTAETASTLGSSDLLLGGVTGTATEDKASDILKRAQSLLLV
jgi:hypothetical protein